MLGGFKAQGRTAEKAVRLLIDARARRGCFSIVLEAVPAPVAEEVTRRLTVPTIGIGAGAATDGQVLVWHDLLGLYDGTSPRFKRYADLHRRFATRCRHTPRTFASTASRRPSTVRDPGGGARHRAAIGAETKGRTGARAGRSP